MGRRGSSDDTAVAREPVAPDGGWGWVVLVASFLSSVIVDGVCFAFGIFYLQFLHHFQENKGNTAWVGSVLNGTYMIMGKSCLIIIQYNYIIAEKVYDDKLVLGMPLRV